MLKMELPHFRFSTLTTDQDSFDALDVRLFRRSLSLLELTSPAYPAINIISCLQALTEDISTPADIAPSALETIVFYCLWAI